MSRFTRTQLIMLAVAALYVLSPADIIPELITGPLGLVDDAAALALIAGIVTGAARTSTTIDGETVTGAANTARR